MNTLQDGLKKWLQNNNIPSPQKIHKKEKKQNQCRSEKLSQRDLNELMGTNMRTWRRGKGGSLRQ